MKPAITLFLLFLISNVKAQTDTTETAIDAVKTVKEEAERMGQAMLNKDFAGYAAFTHPNIIYMYGGIENLVRDLTEEDKIFSRESTKQKIYFGEPSEMIAVDDELQCVLQQTVESKTNTGKEIVKSTLWAVSYDQGKTWNFTDVSDKSLEVLQKTFPSFNAQFEIGESEIILIKQ